MDFSICPAAVVAAPVESVWELLSDPKLYDLWWDAQSDRIVPEGKAAPGQVIYAHATALGVSLGVTMRIIMVNPAKHQIQFHVALPFGTINDQTTTVAALDATSCRVQFG